MPFRVPSIAVFLVKIAALMISIGGSLIKADSSQCPPRTIAHPQRVKELGLNLTALGYKWGEVVYLYDFSANTTGNSNGNHTISVEAVPVGGTNAYGRVRLGQTYNNAINIPRVANGAVRILGKSREGSTGSDFFTYDLDYTAGYVYYTPTVTPGYGPTRGYTANNYIGASINIQCGGCFRGLIGITFNQHHDVDDRRQDGGKWWLRCNPDETIKAGKANGQGPNFNILSAAPNTIFGMVSGPLFGRETPQHYYTGYILGA